MMFEPGLLIAGIAIATVAMAIGIGGGILWTPLLILAYGQEPAAAITTSLLIQVVGMGSGTVAYLRAGLVVPRITLTLTAVALPGVVLGSLLSVSLPQAVVQIVLGSMALTLALLFVAGREPLEAHGSGSTVDTKALYGLLPIPGFFGLMMGVLSVGIGEWVIPALQRQLRLEMSRAIASVVPMMFLLALVAGGLHGVLSAQWQWNHLLWGALGTLIGAQLGARFGQRLKEKRLKESFVYLMTLIGIHLIFQAL